MHGFVGQVVFSRWLTRKRRITVCLLLGIVLLWALPEFHLILVGGSLLFQPQPAPLPTPVDGVPLKHISNSWGAPRSGGRRHQGVDIFAPRGQNIRSTTNGLVLSKGENELGGRFVRILGPRCRVHYYAHLESFADVQVGQRVLGGQIIGTVGNSGNAKTTPSHLHYGIYTLTATAINPHPLLQKARKPT